MPRGGARKNAGRKPKLTPWERIAIGAECDSRLLKAYRGIAKAKNSKKRSMVAKEWAKAKSIPVSERRAWRKSQAESDYLDDVEFALREDRGISPEDPRDPNRVSRIEIRRAKGPTTKIIRRIATRESISEHMVERCLTEFRKIQNSPDET